MEIGDAVDDIPEDIPIVDVDTFAAVEIGDLDELEELGEASFGERRRGSIESLGVMSLSDLEDAETDDAETDGSDDESDDESDNESDDDAEAYIIIPKMPTQCMILENFTHKVDDHLEKDPIKEEEWRSLLFQVIVIL
jgi:hypothetical protein